MKKNVKTDKVNFTASLAKEAEDTATRDNIKHLFAIITRKLAGKCKQAERPIMDKNRVIMTSEEDQVGRWREHFEEMLISE